MVCPVCIATAIAANAPTITAAVFAGVAVARAKKEAKVEAELKKDVEIKTEEIKQQPKEHKQLKFTRKTIIPRHTPIRSGTMLRRFI
jgi:hypothetical protein